MLGAFSGWAVLEIRPVNQVKGLVSPESMFRTELADRVSLAAAVFGDNLQDFNLARKKFKVSLGCAAHLDLTKNAPACLDGIRDAQSEDDLRDAAARCLELKEAYVSLRKALAQGRKDVVRALTQRAKLATRASEKAQAQALKVKKEGSSSSSKPAVAAPASAPPIFQVEGKPLEQRFGCIDEFLSTTVSYDAPWLLASGGLLSKADLPPLSTTIECFSKRLSKQSSQPFCADLSAAIVKGSGDRLAAEALCAVNPPTMRSPASAVPLPASLASVGQTTWLYGLTDPVVTFESGSLGTLYGCVRGQTVWRFTPLASWLQWCADKSESALHNLRGAQLLTAWKSARVSISDENYPEVMEATLSPNSLLWLPPGTIAARMPEDCGSSTLLRQSFLMNSTEALERYKSVLALKSADVLHKQTERLTQEVTLLTAVCKAFTEADVALLPAAKRSPTRALFRVAEATEETPRLA